jgi:4-diphosphocytidyl-2-C-methyl-D-erythritol kinase
VALILPAYAKLNLTLDALGVRPNGYHDIDSVMQTISLHDLILVERSDCRVLDVVGRPIEGENLVLTAARELEGASGKALPFTIRLFKRIPLGAGLGGGSADVAAFLRAANQLYNLELSPAQLVAIGAEIGQDVPFFLEGGTARATGLGSTVTPLQPVPSSWRFLVVWPPIQVSTRAVYQALDGSQPSARRTPALVEALRGPHPEPPPTLPSPQRGEEKSAVEISSHLFGNDLEPTSRRLFPQLDDAINRLRQITPDLHMTGSGGAVFARFEGSRDAAKALTQARELGFEAWVCRPVGGGQQGKR